MRTTSAGRPIGTLATVLLLGLSAFSLNAVAELSHDLQVKVAKYKGKLVEWATDSSLIGAVKESNAKGGLPGMTNAKWTALDDADPIVQGMLKTPASKKLLQWEADKGINKLFVRDLKGNVVAGSSKTLIYSTVSRPAVREALKGAPWSDDAVHRDPTTSVNSVFVSAPILDDGKVIGVIHTAVTAE
jgi:hypothetical protein